MSKIITFHATQGGYNSDEIFAEYEPDTDRMRGFKNELDSEEEDFYHIRDFMERRALVGGVSNHLGSSATSKTTTFANFDITRNESGRIEKIEATGDIYSGYGLNSDMRLRSQYTYDDMGQLTYAGQFTNHVQDDDPDPPIITDAYLFDRRRDYEYDKAGNRKRTANKWNTWAKYNSPSGTYVSDDLDQYSKVESHTQEFLTGFEPNPGSTQWAYDNENVVWDWIRRPGGGKYFYIEYETAPRTDGSGNPIDFQRWWYASWSNPNWNGYYYVGSPQSPTYDADGNMTWDGQSSGSGLALVYEYDRENRLTAIFDDKYLIEFTYDYMNRRVKQVIKDRQEGNALVSTHLYVYHGYHMIAEYEVDESTISTKRTYTWGPDISGTYGGAGGIGGLWLINDFDSGESYIPGYDHQGNIIFLYKIGTGNGTGANEGRVVAEYEYDPYGQIVRETGWVWYEDPNHPSNPVDPDHETWIEVSGDPTGNPFRYQTKWNVAEAYEITSHYNDRNMHLYDFGLRFYHPRHGRFINRDPIGEAGGLNLYAYVGNDPVNLGDFLGLEEIVIPVTIAIPTPSPGPGQLESWIITGKFETVDVENDSEYSGASAGEIRSVLSRGLTLQIIRWRHSNTSSGGTSSRRRASPASSGHSAQGEDEKTDCDNLLTKFSKYIDAAPGEHLFSNENEAAIAGLFWANRQTQNEELGGFVYPNFIGDWAFSSLSPGGMDSWSPANANPQIFGERILYHTHRPGFYDSAIPSQEDKTWAFVDFGISNGVELTRGVGFLGNPDGDFLRFDTGNLMWDFSPLITFPNESTYSIPGAPTKSEYKQIVDCLDNKQ